ncbi:radical SAM protein [Patescibacteria group bacterium]|nr:radical SAM protein [Patescibacteria group bacterium]
MNIKRSFRILSRVSREFTFYVRNNEYAKAKHYALTAPKQALFDLPKTITIEPANICNCHCDFCSAPPALSNRDPYLMPFDDYKKIIDDIKNSTHHLWFFLAGEPFLNPEFPKMVAYAQHHNLDTTTSSNAGVMDSTRAKQIVRSGLDRLIISLDGVSKETHERMRKGIDHEQTMKNIAFLVDEKRRTGSLKPYIELQFIETKVNQHEKEAFIAFAKDLGVIYAIKSFGVPTWVLSEKEAKEVEDTFLPETGKRRYDANKKLKRLKNCINVNRPVIYSNGTVALCCYDFAGKYILGNAFNEPFTHIWRSEKHRKMREAGANRHLPLCKKCGESYEL